MPFFGMAGTRDLCQRVFRRRQWSGDREMTPLLPLRQRPDFIPTSCSGRRAILTLSCIENECCGNATGSCPRSEHCRHATGIFCRRTRRIASCHNSILRMSLIQRFRRNLHLYGRNHFVVNSLSFRSDCGLSDPQGREHGVDAAFKVLCSIQYDRTFHVHRGCRCGVFQRGRCGRYVERKALAGGELRIICIFVV